MFNSNFQIATLFSDEMNFARQFFLRKPPGGEYPEIEEPIKSREKHYLLVLHILTNSSRALYVPLSDPHLSWMFVSPVVLLTADGGNCCRRSTSVFPSLLFNFVHFEVSALDLNSRTKIEKGQNRPSNTFFKPEKKNSVNPFTPRSDQYQTSPAASPEILHHTVWRTWLFMAYSDEE